MGQPLAYGAKAAALRTCASVPHPLPLPPMHPSSFLLRALSLLALLCLPVAATAQMAPLDFRAAPYTTTTGVHANAESASSRVAHTEIVEVKDAPWLRLRFSDADLGAGSYLTVTSLLDGAQQRLDATTLAQWQNGTAYFNGDAVRVELHVAPGDAGVFAALSEVEIGGFGVPESQCGPQDNRVASNDARAGRVMYNGCTGWIIDDGKLVTAGHCISGASVIQFNVPLSSSFGSVRHPGPEDQYSIDFGSRVWTNGGVGNDWGVFRVFNNSQTGLQPIDAQGASFELAQDLGPSTIRITGYGTDSGSANQTQQTHAGPNAGSSGTRMRYQTDTTGGNSGSPVIDEATGRAVGVHTHGGCYTSGGGSNSGTSTFNSAFWSALDATPSGSADVSAALTSGSVLPSGGGLVSVDFTFSNTSGASFSGEWWLRVTLPNGSDGPTFGPFALTLADGASTMETVSKNVGSRNPAGTYTVSVYVGAAFPDDFDNSASVFFTKAAGRPLAGVAGPATWTLENHTRGTSESFVVATGEAASLAVEGVAPNPFSGSTAVRYAVGEAGSVRIAVYDVLGREVAVLVDTEVEAGAHEATFDAAGLGAGVYLYRVEAGSEVTTGRMTLLD